MLSYAPNKFCTTQEKKVDHKKKLDALKLAGKSWHGRALAAGLQLGALLTK